MQFDATQDWRPMLFVAPEAAIDFVKEQQQAQTAPPVEPSRAAAQAPPRRSQ